MNKLKFVSIAIILCIMQPAYSFLTKTNMIEYYKLSRQYNWLSRDVYYIIQYEARNNKLDSALICALIDAESGGKSLVSKKNRDGSRDWGMMQFNSKRIKKGEEWMHMMPMVNIKAGAKELRECVTKSNGFINDAIRFYNQGPNGRRETYKNWPYIKKIVHNYDMSLRAL